MSENTNEHKVNDILVDYEGLCGQLADILEVIDLASAGNEITTKRAVINTVYYAISQLRLTHSETIEEYRKELQA